MEETELKPCWICGGKGVKMLEGKDTHSHYRYMAKCQKCGATAKLCRTKGEAIKTWNQMAELEVENNDDRPKN